MSRWSLAWMSSASALCLACALGALAVACEGEERAPPARVDEPGRRCVNSAEVVDVAEEEAPEVMCPGVERTLLCYGSWAAHCDADGELVDLSNCRESGLVCAAHKCDDASDCTGCRECVPRSVQCGKDGERLECDEDGERYEVVETCDEAAGERCSVSSGVCENLCEAAERARSYIGCEYWAVPTANSQLAFEGVDDDGLCQPFTFAVVVANPQGIDAEITIESPDQPPQTHRVRAGQTATFPLPCSPALKGAGGQDSSSQLARAGAHHIRSTVPVTVYQFNPLEYQSELSTGEEIYSYTNDASLLLPVHSLTGNYVVMSSPTLQTKIDLRDEDLRGLESDSIPGFVAVIGVEPEPTRVVITSSAYTRPSADGQIPALAPGDRLELELARGEVLQLLTETPDECDGEPENSTRVGELTYCMVSQDYDLTGTRIAAEGRISVISGHDCTFLPRNRWACDHLEETMFPVESWGRTIWITMSEGISCQPSVPNMARVISNTDGNQVRFVPAVHEPVELNAGDYLQFEFDQDFQVTAKDPVMVAQFLLGQDYEGWRSAGSLAKGDPAMSLGIPTEQWRNAYAFIAPETFPLNYVNVVAREGQVVLLDGGLLRGFHTVEGTRMAIARAPIEGGEHSIESAETFGIVVYGYAAYTSYMVPGGLDLNLINRPD